MSQIVHSLDLRMNEPVCNNFLIIWLKIARHTSRIWPLVKFALEKSFLPLNENHIVNWTLPRELYPPTSRCFQLWQTRYTHHRIFSRHCFRRGRGDRGRTSNKHFSPQRPILPFLLAPISSSTSPLLKDPLYIYIFPRLDTLFHAIFTLFSVPSFALRHSQISRYPLLEVSLCEWAVHPLKWFFATTFARDSYYSRPLVARDRFIQVIM